MLQEQAIQEEKQVAESAPLNKEEKPQKKKRKIKKRWYVLGAIVLVVAFLLIRCTSQIKQVINQLAYSDTTVLASADIEKSISATGRVESASTENVYSTMSYTVMNVNVEVGDVVSVGDVLCELDPENIQKQINEKEISMDTSKKTSGQQVETAKDNYDNFKDGINSGTNSSLISANSSVQNAYDNWQKAMKAYNDYRNTLNWGENTTILNLETAMDNAEMNLNTARKTYEDAKTAYEAASGQTAIDPGVLAPLESAVLAAQAERDTAQAAYDDAVTRSVTDATVDVSSYLTALNEKQLALDAANLALQQAQTAGNTANIDALKGAMEKAKTAYDTARRAYDNAEAAYHAGVRSASSALDDYARSIETTQRAYETALQSRTAAEVAADNQLEAYKNSLNTAKISAGTDLADYQLEEMYKTLSDATIKAPVAGTVTAVYAKVGASGSGLLFVIEDTESLVVETSVKGYDVGTVKTGLPVTIKSDATGNEVFDGKITTIAPTANKNAQGKTDLTGEEEYATKVEVLSQDTGLRIGMSVRLNYIIEQQSGVLAVPYEAVYQNALDENCVLIAVEQADGKYLLTEVKVEMGIDNDLDVVVSGEGIAPGVRVVNNPSTYAPGQVVTLSNTSTVRQQMGGFAGMMG